MLMHIFLATNNFDEIIRLKINLFRIKFTYELEICEQLPFLDTLITRTDHNITNIALAQNQQLPTNV